MTNPVEQQGQETIPPIIQQTKLWQDKVSLLHS